MKFRVLIFIMLLAILGYEIHRAWTPVQSEEAEAPDSVAQAQLGVQQPAANPQVAAKPTPSTKMPPAYLNAVVIISGHDGAGTGFLCNFHGKPFIVTNQHVVAAISKPSIRSSKGDMLITGRISAATDADIVLIECASIPPGMAPLEIASLPDPSINSGDPVMIPGNSKGDGVITQTQGTLLAIGPQRIEVDNPIYPGNSGSPIIHVATQKVVGVLTEAELVTFNEFEKASFRSNNSTIKTDIRYFGHRIDSARKWETLNLLACQQTESLMKQSRTELNDIFSFFTDSSPRYKDFRELHVALNNAALVYNDKNRSLTDKKEVYQRLMRDIDSLAKRATARVSNRRLSFSQQSSAETLSRMSEHISEATAIIKRDNDLITTLLLRGN